MNTSLSEYCFTYNVGQTIKQERDEACIQQASSIACRLKEVESLISEFRFSSAKRELSAIKADLLHSKRYPRSQYEEINRLYAYLNA